VPNVILSTADAERETGELLAQKEYAAYLGHHDETDPPDIVRLLDEIAADSARRQRLARRSWELVDGRGTDRVVDYIGSL
jgi:spore coat polysaccharide biosynthesis predicted glycosyltransferase SpsG